MSELRFTPEMYDAGIRTATEELRRELAAKGEALRIAIRRFEQLEKYSACEGRPDGDKLLNGLCRAGIMAACADPRYEMYEAYESVEKWLKEYADEALAAIQAGKEQGNS